jgi:hypothetical protein
VADDRLFGLPFGMVLVDVERWGLGVPLHGRPALQRAGDRLAERPAPNNISTPAAL